MTDASHTCGTCSHGAPVEFGMVECGLGWEPHDGLAPSYDRKTRKLVPTQMGHGESLMPQATPDCRCGCLTDRWTPKNLQLR